LTFYADISVAYDDLFPVSPAQRSLLENLREDGAVRSVVDCGCGTGSQLLPLAVHGLSCLGFDPDPSLVAIARRKLSPYPDVRVEEGAFADIPRLAASTFDLLLCLGNSLVHVPRDAAGRFLSDAASVLSSGGGMVLQILNYERLLRDGVTELPLIRSEDGSAELRRRYAWEDRGKVAFHATLRLSTPDGPMISRNEIPLYPLYPEELWEMVASAGFGDVRFFGDFARTGFSEDSEAVVCIARKT
jgi:glycine/sarcosine N-methyltransferase